MTRRPFDAVVIGAGPYGLAVSAHLRRADANVHVLGVPMSFWKKHMPKGMRLRSPWGASHIGHPRSGLSLREYERSRGGPLSRPIPLTDFIDYARWFQERAVPDIDTRRVTSVERSGDIFRVVVDDGETIETRRVIVAAGIAPFAHTPTEFAGLPDELVSHTSDHDDLDVFAGRRVAVIGGGQSAIESAALLGEGGADVEVIMRARQLRWVGRATRDGILGRLLFDRTDVGPALVSHIVARPRFLRRLPLDTQHDFRRRSLASGASLWIRPRLGAVRISAGRSVAGVARDNGGVRIRLDDGTTRDAQHVLLGTGYRVDVRRYEFLAPALRERIACVEGYPTLNGGLESSVPGLHFAGAQATHSFGPLLRFVSGTEFASRTIVRAVTGRGLAPLHPSIADRDLELGRPEQQA